MRRPTVSTVILLAALACWGRPSLLSARQLSIQVDAGRPMDTLSGLVYGSCIEDVNHEIYGGLYAQKLFGESFEEPSPPAPLRGWRMLGGHWRWDGHSIHVDAGPDYKLVRQAPVATDLAIETELRVLEGFNAGLLLRVSAEGPGVDQFDGYEVSLTPGSGRIILGKHRHNWQPLQEASLPCPYGTWMHIRVELQGPRIRIYADGRPRPLIDFTDRDAPLQGHRIALRTFNARAEFRRLQLREKGHTVPLTFRAAAVPAVSGTWDPVLEGSGGTFALDTSHAFNGRQCQVIRKTEGTGRAGVANRGLNRWGIAVSKGLSYRGRVYLRGKVAGPVFVSLESADGGQTYARAELTGVGEKWKRFDITLRSSATDPQARYVLDIRDPGVLQVDQALLLPPMDARFHALPLRGDIGRMMQAEGLSFLRYGGTMVNAPGYRWKNMIGDRDRRPPYRGHWYPYSSNGFGIEEFLQFCRAAAFEPAFAVNVEETPEDMAGMVEYLNGDSTTFWGRRRAEAGHPAPYGVRYIEIGNEEAIASDDSAAYDHYVERFLLLYEAIHHADPGIQLVQAAWWRPGSPNMERVFRALDGKAAFWDLHLDADPADAGRTADRRISEMQAQFRRWNPDTRMRCAIFEENGGHHDLRRALGHAGILNAVRRHADFILTACAANALQPLGQNDNGWDQGQIFFTPDRVWGMPPFYAQRMASSAHQPILLYSHADSILDITATRSGDSSTLVLHVVNPSGKDVPVTVQISGLGDRCVAHALSLSGNPDEVNSLQQPERIVPREKTFRADPRMTPYTFPPYSYTILRFER